MNKGERRRKKEKPHRHSEGESRGWRHGDIGIAHAMGTTCASARSRSARPIRILAGGMPLTISISIDRSMGDPRARARAPARLYAWVRARVRCTRARMVSSFRAFLLHGRALARSDAPSLGGFSVGWWGFFSGARVINEGVKSGVSRFWGMLMKWWSGYKVLVSYYFRLYYV